jgi:hypothetical protein
MVLFDINIIIITPGEYGFRFEVHRNTLRDAAKLPIALKFAHPNNLIWKHFEDNYTLFRILFDSVPQLPEYSGTPVK